MDVAVNQLKKSSNSAVYNALIQIRKEFLKEDNGVRKLRETGGLKLLLYHIQKPEERVVDVSLSILGNCCLEPETRKLVRQLDGISYVVRNLESSKNESILNRSCRVLANLAIDEINGDEIHRLKAVQIIIAILSSAKDQNLLQSALRALRLLSNTSGHRKNVINHGGAECLGKLLVQVNSDTPENVLLAILKALSTLAVDSHHWKAGNCLKSEYVEALVSRINDHSEIIQNTALYILSNLSKEESFRPVLGNAGIFPVLIKRVNQWEKNLQGWQWAVDCFCQGTRESGNRAKIRQEGGLEILLRLLKEKEDERLWLRSLASIINFSYDETSISLLVELGMVEVLTERFIQLTVGEELIEHREDFSKVDLVQREVNLERKDTPSSSTCDNYEQQLSPTLECYSPEYSPAYFGQFGPALSPIQHSLGYSPGRSISPDRQEQMDEFCYSPVYELDVSDESESEIKSPKYVEEQPNLSAEMEDETFHSEIVPVDDSKTDENVKFGDTTGRSPLGDIIMILSRLSLRENPTSIFLKSEKCVLEEIVNYLTKVKLVNQKSIRIVNRILRNPLCFERVILLRIPALIVRKMFKKRCSSYNCVACSSISNMGESFLSELNMQAESGFGYGVLQHLLEGKSTMDDKISAISAAALLVSSLSGRRRIFIESSGLSLLTEVLSDMEATYFNEAANSLALFSSRFYLTDPEEWIGKDTTKNCQLPVHNQCNSDSVQLCASDKSESISVERAALSSKSEVFNAMLNGNFMESKEETITIQCTSSIALKCLIHYIYSCRRDGCLQLFTAFRNEPVEVICDVLTLADRFLMCEVKRSIISDLISRHKNISYLPSEITEIFNRSIICNYPILENWAVLHLLTDFYGGPEIRRTAFNLLSTDGQMKTRAHDLLMNQFLKPENDQASFDFKDAVISKYY